MKANQITIITIAAVLLFTLAGCDKTDGEVVLKEPKPELVDRGINYSVTHGLVDQGGNPIAPKETEQ